ncbi:PREDICTED: homeobox-leucine zipper protein HAT5-like isoform X2 [Lupinus angustifolius]|uniref:homeobox-leucine zipper protein HAT5-like isoform X2 n=1 Tax=Lupinus angustifolius TaxID=3871 RepID=UPI00092E6D1B|nr:PREDICTED: homeobox-leucine zipper protein HAT5-like isoform X2 [Lupinus angustifolius]
MASGKLYGGPNMTDMLQNERLPCSSEVLESLWVHNSDPASFQGPKSVIDFENISSSRIRERLFFQALDKEENCDEDYDSCLHQPGKKRRLTSEQVQFLERNFEVENKLEPERKVQLAKELGLQPRQVAIWFQNRRARFKTKQLEKEYGTLKASFDRLKVDYESFIQENQKLKDEVNSLKNKLIPRDKETENSDDKSSSPNAVNTPYHKEEPIMKDLISSNTPKTTENESKLQLPIMVTCKVEDANSAKSDVLDSDSTEDRNNHPSSFVMETATDYFSQDDEDELSEKLFTLPCLPKVEDACYDENPEHSCNFGFQVEDQTFCFWPY